MSNYATKKELDRASGVETSETSVQRYFITLKAEINKLDINRLVNIPASLNNSKTKVNDLDVGKLKTVPVDLKRLRDVVHKEVLKNKNLNTLKTKVNSSEKRIPDATTLIHIN